MKRSHWPKVIFVLIPAMSPNGLRELGETKHQAARPLRVGLVWAGSPHNSNDANRSISLDVLEPILRTQGIHFNSLQKGDAAAQLERRERVIRASKSRIGLLS